MDWLKNSVGDELYSELETGGFIEKLKKSMGDVEYIPHDKDKWIEKAVFNNQRAEMKSYKDRLSQYELELESRKSMITDEELKTKMLEKDKILADKVTEIKNNFEKLLEKANKENALMQLFTTNGCIDSKMLINNVNFEDVLIKDGVILNGKELVEGFKKSAPYIFNTNAQPNIPNRGSSNTKTTKELLQEEINKTPPGAAKFALYRKMEELQKSEN